MAGSSGARAGPRRLKLAPLSSCSDVPPHPELAASQKDAPELDAFLKGLYHEAEANDFSVFKKIGSAKSQVDGHAVVVDKLKYQEKEEEGGELWFGRRSEHEQGKPVKFEELEIMLRKDHEKNEANYTPAIYDVNTVLEWDLKGKSLEWEEQNDGTTTQLHAMANVELKITQMHHMMPGGLLADRVFTVLLFSYTKPPTQESLDMQIPLSLADFPSNIQARSHVHSPSSSKSSYLNDSPDATPTQKQRNKKPLVEGRYVSLERARRGDGGEKGKWIWEMKTASDASGNLPMWMQKMGVPGAIVKDVPLALEFAVKSRGKE